jgi:hypothetical protein
MAKIIIGKAVVKGYHIFQIRPPPTLYLPITKEYGNTYDPNACHVWVPEYRSIPQHMMNIVTDAKRGETVKTIAGLLIGRVPEGLSSVFTELLSSSAIDKIEW